MSEVVQINFGKEDRERLRRFMSLMSIVEKHEAAVLADPIKYLSEAGDVIVSLRREIFQIWEIAMISRCVTAPWSDQPEISVDMRDDVTYVRRKELEALREVYRRVSVLAGMESPK
jgi:hypothetical protein